MAKDDIKWDVLVKRNVDNPNLPIGAIIQFVSAEVVENSDQSVKDMYQDFVTQEKITKEEFDVQMDAQKTLETYNATK